ncbi:hypothetical protein FF38_00277 [Lucilia cuprina]|uniref:Uncharacterized protein n=1 Tax=Lucilia cuprina TaxID=7375 RepID=A0A0L0CKL8_LUCCU|nr:hypothetical protein FF38_00277 [Lucilia cuprina]
MAPTALNVFTDSQNAISAISGEQMSVRPAFEKIANKNQQNQLQQQHCVLEKDVHIKRIKGREIKPISKIILSLLSSSVGQFQTTYLTYQLGLPIPKICLSYEDKHLINYEETSQGHSSVGYLLSFDKSTELISLLTATQSFSEFGSYMDHEGSSTNRPARISNAGN